MELKTLAEGFLGANCYLLYDSGHAFIVDPAARLDVMCAALYEDGLALDGILLTHGHFDHVMNLEPLLSRFSVPVYLGAGDRDFASDGRKNGFSVFFGQDRTFPMATNLRICLTASKNFMQWQSNLKNFPTGKRLMIWINSGLRSHRGYQ